MKFQIITNDNKIIICDSAKKLNETLVKLKDNFKELKAYTLRTKAKKTETVMITFTEEQRKRYTEKAKEVGCSTLQEYIRFLLVVNQELSIIQTVQSNATINK